MGGAENAVPVHARTLYRLNRLEFTGRSSSSGTSVMSLNMFSLTLLRNGGFPSCDRIWLVERN
jgi:hypothetical protein